MLSMKGPWSTVWDYPEMPAAMPIWFAPQQIVAETASAADISLVEG
jgi:hypothetical protein